MSIDVGGTFHVLLARQCFSRQLDKIIQCVPVSSLPAHLMRIYLLAKGFLGACVGGKVRMIQVV